MKYPIHVLHAMLGAHYARKKTTFRVWAPTASAMEVCLYADGLRGKPRRILPMRKGLRGTWSITVRGNLHGVFYTYRATVDGIIREAVDPYAKAAGANGQRGMVVDLKRTDPAGWSRDFRPPSGPPTDAVIYELHVRDATIHPASGVRYRGKYLGLTEKPVLDHLCALGVTHVHLLPVQDFESADETRPNKKQYNWGYDPQNYNVPEGAYATNAFDGTTRIREFKQMVMALHKAGIRVVLDVVYNHTYRAQDSNFNKLVPGYYYRQNAEGGFSNGSGCGNETASDRAMFRKFMVESVVYWAKEYHVDGFRFDLMGLHDLRTMREIRRALDRVDPSIIVYGEGWTGGDSPLPAARRAMKTNVRRLRGVAAFSDTIRDAIKGPVNDHTKPGFVNGGRGLEEMIKIGVVASTRHPQVRYPARNDWHGPWAEEPWRCITYDSCHDNHTLWDRIKLGSPRASEAERIRMNKLAAAILLTSQGITFLHAGEEFLRTKYGEENSYNKPDEINRLDWPRCWKYRAVVDYYRGLIALRKAHPAFRLTTASGIRESLRFLRMPSSNMVGFTLQHAKNVLYIIYNANAGSRIVRLPSGGWGVLVDHERAGATPFREVSGRVALPGRSALVCLAS